MSVEKSVESQIERFNGDKKKEPIVVRVRWMDGYCEKFDCDEFRFGGSLLWMRLMNGENRHIPTDRVRTYSVYPESHERPLNNK